ncbi:MAG: abhydrolase domain-containing 18 [Sphingobacteriales bacterium]|nr:MAG: abhydrolase domain-containing 18 [Sphingobacteriales bacterium]
MKDILLLHGAIGSKAQLEPMALLLKEKFTVHLLNLPGHGGEPFPSGGFSIEVFADAVIKWLDEKGIEQICIFGYSMGGYVAMMLAKKYPQRVEKIITLATKFDWNEAVAAKEIKMLQPEIIEEKIPAFAAELARRHFPLNWKDQLMYTQNMLLSLGIRNALALADYKEINTPCLLMLGDKDKMVSLQETADVYAQIPQASLAVLPQMQHPIEKADNVLLKFHLERFLLT